MLGRFLRHLENAQHPILGPNLKALALMGMWRPEPSLIHYAHDLLGLLCVVFVFSQCAQLCFVWGELTLVMENLSVTTVSAMSVIKMATFRAWHDSWHELILAVSHIETSQQRGGLREQDRKVVERYVLHSRIVTYFFGAVVLLTISMVMASPALLLASSSSLREACANGSAAYPQIFSAWLPVEAARPPRYWGTVLLHVTMGYYGAGALAAWDTSVVVTMVFFRGQLELLRNACVRSLDEDGELAHRRIIACHRHHVFLLKYSRMFNSVVSPVMFLYFIICSVMLCAIALQITTQASTPLQLFWTLEFLLATSIQLFLFYWHSNDVLTESGRVEAGVYAARWEGRGGRTAREAAMLARGLRIPIVFSAGPFNDMTVATFIAILKAAYSYFALLRARQQGPSETN